MAFDNDSSDEELMVAYQEGAEGAFDILFYRHSSRVYGFLVNKLQDRPQADDVFQATFLKLHQSRNRYDPTLPFLPWLFSVCKSVLVDHVRKRQRVQEDSNNFAVTEAIDQRTENTGPPEIGLDILSAQQHAIIDLRYGENLSFEEIALKLQTSPSNVRQIISRSIRRLRQFSRKKENKV